MRGRPIPLIIERFDNINFSPGIPLGTAISPIPVTETSDAKREAYNYFLEMVEVGDWKRTWTGIPYHVAAKAYKERISRKLETRARYSGSVWTVDDVPTAEDEEYIAKYYDAVRELGKRRSSGWDMWNLLRYSPRLLRDPPPGMEHAIQDTPIKRNISEAEWWSRIQAKIDDSFIEVVDDEPTAAAAEVTLPPAPTVTAKGKGKETAVGMNAGKSGSSVTLENQSVLPIRRKRAVDVTALEDDDDSEREETPARTWRPGMAPLVRRGEPSTSQSTVDDSEEWGGIESREGSALLQRPKLLTPKKGKGKKLFQVPSRTLGLLMSLFPILISIFIS